MVIRRAPLLTIFQKLSSVIKMRIFSSLSTSFLAFVGCPDRSARTSTMELDATRGEVLARWRAQRIAKVGNAPSIDDFSYTEALMSAARDPEVKQAFKIARQAMLDFVSDVNFIYLAAKTPYLQEGQVTMPYTNRTIYRDAESNKDQISNSGIVRLVQAASDSQMLLVRSFGTPSITAYATKQNTTAQSFNIDLITQTMDSLFSSWNQGTTAGVESSIAAVGSLLNTSFTENKQESHSVSISPLCAFDYDDFWDEVVASYQTSIFNISLTTWKTVEQKKGTTKETEQVTSEYAVEAYRNGVNLPRLVAFYNNPVNGFAENTVGGNVADIGAVGGSLLPLPRPNLTVSLYMAMSSPPGTFSEPCGLPVYREK